MIFSKFSRISCLISFETIAKLFMSQSRILDNERMFDPVILNEFINFFIFYKTIKNDYCVIIFSNYVPDESVRHKK